MSEKENGQFACTTPVVMAFPALFEARQFKRNGKTSGDAKFGGAFLFDPDSEDLKEIRTIAVKVAKAKWPTRNFKADMDAGRFKLPFMSGTTLADQRKAEKKDDKGEFQRGKIVLQARSKFQPALSVFDAGKVIDLEDNAVLIAKHKGAFYFGALVVPEFNLVPYEGGNGPDGVTAYLNAVLTTGKGTRLTSGGGPASDRFRGYLGQVVEEDPTAGAAEVFEDNVSF